MDDLDDGVEVTITPDGPICDAYDQTYADNERSTTIFRGQLRPPRYIHKDFVEEDDIANINSIMALTLLTVMIRMLLLLLLKRKTRILLLLKKRLILVIRHLKLQMLL